MRAVEFWKVFQPGNTYNQVGKGVPLINGPVEFGSRFPSKLQWTTTLTKFCNPGDILFCVRGSTTGRINIANDRFCIGRGVAAIRGKEGLALTDFVELFLRRLAEIILSEARGNGSTFPSVNSKRLATTLLLLPPFEEQKHIVEILSTVDEAIARTESLIAKLKQMKAGLLHDLLTRGLDENGELRDAIAHPEHFKDSPLGQIPKEWVVEQFGEHIAHLDSGWSPICNFEPAANGEWGVLKTTAVVWSGYNSLENKKLPSNLQPRYQAVVEADDILITRKGPRERVGVVVYIPSTPPHLMIPAFQVMS